MTVHSERCRECKTRVHEVLTSLYGDCLVNHAFPWPSRPEAYGQSVAGEILQGIFKDLGLLRGHRDFIKAPQMPPCDFYCPRTNLIVEFDESQHFTLARRITLEHYYAVVPVGFSVPQWIALCEEIAAFDNDPPDRDERRAWYDALRDILPSLHGFKPTVRIYSEAFRWCALRADSEHDLATFRSIVPGMPEPPEP